MENKKDKLTNQEATKNISKKRHYSLYGIINRKVKRFVKIISHNKTDKKAKPKATEKSSKKKPHKLYDIVNRKVKSFAKTTSHKELEERLHPLESCHKQFCVKKEEIENKARGFKVSAYRAAEESIGSYEKSVKLFRKVINSTKSVTVKNNEVNIQAQEVLIQIQTTVYNCRKSVSNAVLCIQTCADPPKTLTILDDDSPIQQLSTLLEEEITKLDATVKQANELIYSHQQPDKVLAKIGEACNISQKVVYATFDAVNASEQSTAKLSAEVVTCKKITANINKSREALALGKVQEAWGHYYEAELLGYYFMDESALKANAQQILHGSPESLDSLETKTIHTLLAHALPDGSWELNENLCTEDVIAARHIVQNHFVTEYTKLGMILRQLQILVFVSILLICGVLALLVLVPNYGLNTSSFEATNFFAKSFISSNGTAENFTATGVTAQNVIASGNISAGNPYFFLAIGLFGALGGTFSAITTLVRGTEGEVPERLANSWLSLAKPVIGAAAAVAIFVFLLGGFVTFTQSLSNYLIFALAFAAGFSERLILGAVSSVSGGEKKEK